MTNASTVLNQICQFFGGTYDPNFHAYTTPTVTGLSLVRRGWSKREDFNDYFYGQPDGTMSGCILYVQIPETHDMRAALPAVQGRRQTRFLVELHGFIWSKALYVEDAQDFGYTLRDAIVAKIRTDPTLGSGGFEAGNFQVGEGDAPDVATHLQQMVTEVESTKGYLLVQFEAHSYDVA